MRHLLIAFALLLAPRVALACPVCFGQSDSPMAQGVNMGIYFMLGTIGVVLLGFAAFIVYLVRRARLFSEEGPADAAGYALNRSQEGTASC